MQIVKKPANPLILNDRVIVFDHIEVMGQGVLPSGEMHLVIRDLKSILEKEVPIPVELLASGQTGPLQKLFIKYGLYTLAAKKPNKVREELLRVMQEVRLKPLVISPFRSNSIPCTLVLPSRMENCSPAELLGSETVALFFIILYAASVVFHFPPNQSFFTPSSKLFPVIGLARSPFLKIAACGTNAWSNKPYTARFWSIE